MSINVDKPQRLKTFESLFCFISDQPCETKIPSSPKPSDYVFFWSVLFQDGIKSNVIFPWGLSVADYGWHIRRTLSLSGYNNDRFLDKTTVFICPSHIFFRWLLFSLLSRHPVKSCIFVSVACYVMYCLGCIIVNYLLMHTAVNSNGNFTLKYLEKVFCLFLFPQREGGPTTMY